MSKKNDLSIVDNKITMCEHCREILEYSVLSRDIQEEVDGVSVSYTEEYAVCNKCNNEVYVGEIHDKNLYNFNEAFKVSTGIISINEIEEIISKYNIGKKPLSMLLGWGENTVSRYISGDFPTKKYSDVLKRILEDPNYMLRLLEENKSNITEVAYNKCKNSIQPYTVSEQISINELAKYIINKHDITPKALQKILYFIQGFTMAFNKTLLFNDAPQAWIHGPVYPVVYNTYCEFKYNIIDIMESSYDEVNLNVSDNEKNLIDCILRFFTKYSGDVLEKITHIESPWLEARQGLSKNEPSKNPIKLESISEYFMQVKNKYNMINYYDIKQYLDDMISKIE
jgi:uncharacterized phage-associated protein